jgi:hypothetical protein
MQIDKLSNYIKAKTYLRYRNLTQEEALQTISLVKCAITLYHKYHRYYKFGYIIVIIKIIMEDDLCAKQTKDPYAKQKWDEFAKTEPTRMSEGQFYRCMENILQEHDRLDLLPRMKEHNYFLTFLKQGEFKIDFDTFVKIIKDVKFKVTLIPAEGENLMSVDN